MARRKQQPEQEQDTFDSIIGGYPEEFLGCRDFGHSWRPVTARREKDGTYVRQLGCALCGAQRHQRLDRDGYVLGSGYTYRTGYLIPGTGRLSPSHRAALRLASIVRALP